MEKFIKRELKISLFIVLGGLVIPALLSIVFSGFRVNLISIVNYEFFTGILISTIGGIIIVSDFFLLRKRVISTPLSSESDEDEEGEGQQSIKESDDSKKDKPINWPYLLLCTGIVIVLAAVAIGEIF